MTIEAIQKAVLAEWEKARTLPMVHREDARCAISHALAQHLVDCMLRQGALQAAMRVDGYELLIRPVMSTPQVAQLHPALAAVPAKQAQTLLAA